MAGECGDAAQCDEGGTRLFLNRQLRPTDHSTLYTAPVTVPAGAVLKAVAMSSGLQDRAVVTSAK